MLPEIAFDDGAHGEPLAFDFEGRRIEARPGQTIAAALIAAGVGAFRRDSEGNPRMPFCGMGTCFECTMKVDGESMVRTCMTTVQGGAVVAREAPR